jgi:hypothetical protein
MNWKMKILYVVMAIVGVYLTLLVNGALAVEGFDPETCPDGPFMSPPYTAYCDYVNTIPGDDSWCYDIDANFDCTPLPPPVCSIGNDCEMQPEFCYRDESGIPMCGAWNPDGPTDCSGNSWPLMPCTDPSLNLCFDEDIPCPEPCGAPGEPECPPEPCGAPGEPECPPPPVEEGQYFMIKKASCLNKTTGQKVVIKDQSMTLDCEAAGLEMSEGDEVVIKMKGIVE